MLLVGAALRTIPPRCWEHRRRRRLLSKAVFRRRCRPRPSPPPSTARRRGAHTAASCSRFSASFSPAICGCFQTTARQIVTDLVIPRRKERASSNLVTCFLRLFDLQRFAMAC